MRKWKKFIELDEARELSKIFCKHFILPYCDVYYVDRIKESGGYTEIYANYINLDPPHMLIVINNLNPIGVIMHELTHHVEYYLYDNVNYHNNQHGYYYQLAKKRVIKWCKKNISSNADWSKPLGAILHKKDMKAFKL